MICRKCGQVACFRREIALFFCILVSVAKFLFLDLMAIWTCNPLAETWYNTKIVQNSNSNDKILILTVRGDRQCYLARIRPKCGRWNLCSDLLYWRVGRTAVHSTTRSHPNRLERVGMFDCYLVDLGDCIEGLRLILPVEIAWRDTVTLQVIPSAVFHSNWFHCIGWLLAVEWTASPADSWASKNVIPKKIRSTIR